MFTESMKKVCPFSSERVTMPSVRCECTSVVVHHKVVAWYTPVMLYITIILNIVQQH